MGRQRRRVAGNIGLQHRWVPGICSANGSRGSGVGCGDGGPHVGLQCNGFQAITPDRDRAAAERDSLPLISGSPVFNTAACHSVSTSRVAEQIKSHLRAWTGTIRCCVKLPDSKLNYFRRKYRAAHAKHRHPKSPTNLPPYGSNPQKRLEGMQPEEELMSSLGQMLKVLKVLLDLPARRLNPVPQYPEPPTSEPQELSDLRTSAVQEPSDLRTSEV
ncbi:hypothetical protein EYF80_027734 [Liparis tanakae]|uniref:Uncharacterized protein n=1 Tax=Liparis tanakae TaxID=230148 RepID=A0A4Z2HAM2_9TELE|nr:hypothetical protein EYF80_027734 [Liparis tanakae]